MVSTLAIVGVEGIGRASGIVGVMVAGGGVEEGCMGVVTVAVGGRGVRVAVAGRVGTSVGKRTTVGEEVAEASDVGFRRTTSTVGVEVALLTGSPKPEHAPHNPRLSFRAACSALNRRS